MVIPDSARWSKPSTGGRTEDEAHNFDRIVNSWYLTPHGTKFSQKEGGGQSYVDRYSTAVGERSGLYVGVEALR